MATRRLGEILIDRVIESEEPFLPPHEMFAEATPEALAPHRPWLEPRALCPESGKLILPVQSYLLRTRHHTILIDSCVGNDKSFSWHEPWHRRRDPTWLANLAAAGVRPERIDFVLCTHLHVDHCGWNTRLVEGRWVPTFPNARYVFSRQEFAHRESLDDTTFRENVLPVMEAGQGVLVEMDHALDRLGRRRGRHDRRPDPQPAAVRASRLELPLRRRPGAGAQDPARLPRGAVRNRPARADRPLSLALGRPRPGQGRRLRLPLRVNPSPGEARGPDNSVKAVRGYSLARTLT
jgi:hypothetical protein